MTKTRAPLTVHILAWLAVAAPFTVLADASDAAPGAEAESAAGQLQEIIVTSQKRAEDIKDIPISVSAISGAQLAEHHVADYDDITRTVPGISFAAGPGRVSTTSRFAASAPLRDRRPSASTSTKYR